MHYQCHMLLTRFILFCKIKHLKTKAQKCVFHLSFFPHRPIWVNVDLYLSDINAGYPFSQKWVHVGFSPLNLKNLAGLAVLIRDQGVRVMQVQLLKNKSPLTATMCSIMAPLFRSSLVKKSSGNSCIAGKRGNVTVTTHQQHDSEAHVPAPPWEDYVTSSWMLVSEEQARDALLVQRA